MELNIQMIPVVMLTIVKENYYSNNKYVRKLSPKYR